jgi:16S rRNA (adenine1518-N6/adenine1519-N6)-dimethyltransferase
VVVANLPYNVGTPIVLTMLRAVPRITRLVVMLQREAVDRLVADPGSKVMPRWSCASTTVRSAAGTRPCLPEQGGSSVAVIDRIPADPARETAIGLAAAGFGQRRKMLRSSLRGRVTEEALRAAGIDPAARAETLAPADRLRLARAS